MSCTASAIKATAHQIARRTQMLAFPSPSRVAPDRGGGTESFDASSRSSLRMSAPDTSGTYQAQRNEESPVKETGCEKNAQVMSTAKRLPQRHPHGTTTTNRATERRRPRRRAVEQRTPRTSAASRGAPQFPQTRPRPHPRGPKTHLLLIIRSHAQRRPPGDRHPRDRRTVRRGRAARDKGARRHGRGADKSGGPHCGWKGRAGRLVGVDGRRR